MSQVIQGEEQDETSLRCGEHNAARRTTNDTQSALNAIFAIFTSCMSSLKDERVGNFRERCEDARIYNMYICGPLCGDYDLFEYGRSSSSEAGT